MNYRIKFYNELEELHILRANDVVHVQNLAVNAGGDEDVYKAGLNVLKLVKRQMSSQEVIRLLALVFGVTKCKRDLTE